MVEDLGEYNGIRMFHDSEMCDLNILFGNAKKKRLPNGDIVKPLNVYKESISKEPFILDNKNFRLPRLSDYKRKVKVTWIIGGPNDPQVYKDAIDYINQNLSLL